MKIVFFDVALILLFRYRHYGEKSAKMTYML